MWFLRVLNYWSILGTEFYNNSEWICCFIYIGEFVSLVMLVPDDGDTVSLQKSDFYSCGSSPEKTSLCLVTVKLKNV
jgi:hypothetical protein